MQIIRLSPDKILYRQADHVDQGSVFSEVQNVQNRDMICPRCARFDNVVSRQGARFVRFCRHHALPATTAQAAASLKLAACPFGACMHR